MATKDFKLDPLTHDLDVSTKDLQFVNGIDFYAQDLKITLLFFWSEWYLDTTLGIKFLELIFIKNFSQTLVDNLIKTAIKDKPYVIEITEYASNFNRTTRLYNIVGKVLTDAGEIELPGDILSFPV